jgi:hypothetical protein
MKTLTAIIRDTLLSLRRRRLFWLHLWLSVAVVVLYGSISCHGAGWSIGYGLKNMDNSWLRQGTPWESTLHCWTLARIMRWWVAGGAVFLALFATASVLPETLEPGNAALIIPRTRSRSLILAGRFIGALIYAMLHSALVVAGLWLVFRWRMGEWYHGFWLAVPLAALLFAPLQAVAMLLGVLTRSATAALLVAILFAGTVWAIQEAAAPPDVESEAAGVPAVAPADAPANGLEHERGDEGSSGLGDLVFDETARIAGTLLPRSRRAMEWLERHASPPPPEIFSYRDLFRNLRIGRRGLGAAAVDAIAETSDAPVPKKELEAIAFTPLLLSSAGFTVAVMVFAAWLLKRRDL